jgi:hypothetical protein
MSEVEVGLLIRAAPSRRDRVLLEVIYAGGLRVSETVALTWADVLPRDDRVQLSILGKGGKVRATRTARMPSTAALRCPRCSQRWATATSPPHQVTCTPGPTRQAAYTSILGCFFDEEPGKGKRLRR